MVPLRVLDLLLQSVAFSTTLATSMHAEAEAERQAHAVAEAERPWKPACDEYAFAYSTGHVGTTSLCDRETYADGPTMKRSDVAFFFEPDGTVKQHGLSLDEQEDHVRKTYLEALSRVRPGDNVREPRARLCVDLSHFNLLYFEGLIRVMRAERLPFKLVRIHRDAMEVARSVSRKGLAIGFRPFDAPESLELNIDATAAKQLSALELNLYAVDETEAQWRKILSGWGSGQILTCSWSEYAPMGLSFVDECVGPIARFLGLNAAPAVRDTRDHNNPQESAHARHDDIALLMCYRAKMHKASSTYRWLGSSLPSGVALRNRMHQYRASVNISELHSQTAHCGNVGVYNLE